MFVLPDAATTLVSVSFTNTCAAPTSVPTPTATFITAFVPIHTVSFIPASGLLPASWHFSPPAYLKHDVK